MPSIFSRSRTQSTPDTPVDNADEFGRVKKKKSSKLKNTALPSSPAETPSLPFSQPALPDGAFLPPNLSPNTASQSEYGYLSYKRDIVLSLEQVARLTEVICEELGSRGGIATPFVFSSLALDINMTGIKRLIDRFIDACRAGGKGEPEHRWREEARFSGPHELAMVLRWGLGRVVRFVGGLELRGLISWEHYQEFRDSEQALNYPPSHFTSFLPALAPALRSIVLTTLSLLTRLTAHSQTSGHTPPTLSPLFGPLFFGLGPQVGAFHHTYAYYLRATHATEHLLLAFIRWQDSPNRNVDPSVLGPGAQTTLSVPTRLKEWIKDYPSTLPFLSSANSDPHSNPQPRKGARTIRVLSVRRNVRMYSKDLVKSASSWAYRKPQSQGIEPNGLIGTREWERISPPNPNSPGTLPPRYSDSYRKRMNFNVGFQPDSTYNPTPATHGLSSPNPSSGGGGLVEVDLFGGSTLSLVSSRHSGTETSATAQFRSLTDLKWGEFESLGFSSPSLLSPNLSSSSSILSTSSVSSERGDLEKKLQFDLTESARSYSRSSKRQTLTWNDFSSAGFSRSDSPLSTSLSFSPHLTLPSSATPGDREKEERKLRKAYTPPSSKMPVFGWDTTPVLGGEEVVEEAFLDVFCDLVWGWSSATGGPTAPNLSASERGLSMDDERTLQKDLDRDCNWALIDFKCLPPNTRGHGSSVGDPRTSSCVLLFEEFVPFEYRQELAKVYGLVPSGGLLTSSQRIRLGSLFGTKQKTWKQASTLNGRPYVVGHVPSSPSSRELEFEGLLRGTAATKVIPVDRDREKERKKLSTGPLPLPPAAPVATPPKPVVSDPLYVDRKEGGATPTPKLDTTAATLGRDSPSASPATKKSRFRMPNPRVVPKGATPAEYSTVDFDTRYTGYSDESDSPLGDDPAMSGSMRDKKMQEKMERMKRRESRMNGEDDDAWVDILVGTQSRRMQTQEAQMFPGAARRRVGAGRGGQSDPDLASMEVAQALAGVRRSSSSESLRQKKKSKEAYEHDTDVDEVETVPRGRQQPVQSYVDSEADLDAEPVSMYDDSRYSKADSSFEYEDGSEEDVVQAALRAARDRRNNASYFDMHPDRRPISTATAGSQYTDDGSETGIAYDESEEGEEKPAGAGKPASPPQGIRPLPTVPQKSNIPVPTNPVPSIRQQQENGNEHAPAPEAKPETKTPSKTAALIEMYREKEKSGSSSPAGLPPLGVPVAPLVPTPSPSRLPVRTTPLPKEPSPKPTPTTTPSPPVDLEPPKPGFNSESGRASPARYIHGAPLHNVLEEEEEE